MDHGSEFIRILEYDEAVYDDILDVKELACGLLAFGKRSEIFRSKWNLRS